MIPAARAVRRSVERVGLFMGYAAGWGFIAVSALITFDVLARRLFGVSSQATTELSGYALAVGISWALAHTLTQRAHIRIDVLVDRLPGGIRVWLRLLSLVFLGVLAGALFYGASTLAEESWLFDATDVSVLRVPLVVPQGLWALGIGVFLALIAAVLAEGLLLALGGRGRDAEALLRSRGYKEEVAEALDAVGEAPSSSRKEAKS